MASYARDIYFGVRVTDRATGPLRRIARDMRMLGKQGLEQRQTVARRADLTASRARNTRLAAAQEYLAAKRAYDLDVKRAQLAVKRANEAKRTALLNQRAAKAAVVTDVQAATDKAANAQLARRRAANAYLDKRSGTARIAQAQREAQFIDGATRARLKSAGVLKGINALERQRIGIVTQVQQAELALAQREGTTLGKKFEANLAQAATISPRVLSRSGRGILMSGLSIEQLKNKIKSLGIAQSQLVHDEDALAKKAGLASGALNKQRLAADRLVASEAKLNAETAMAAATFRSRSNAARRATAAVPVVEAAAQAKAVSTTKDLTFARQRYNLAVQSGEVIEANAAARLTRSTNTLRTASDGYRIAKQRAADLNKEVVNFKIDRLKGIAMYIRHIGFALSTVGAIGVFAFGSMAKASADFNTQVTLAATQTAPVGDRSIKNIQKNATAIQAAIQKQLASGKVIATPQEQTGAAYRIYSGTTLPGNQKQQLKEGIGLLREFNQVTTANVGLVKLDEVVSAGLTILNRFRVPLRQMPKELNTMQAAVRFGNINLSQFISALNVAAPAAQSAGFSFTDVSAAIAFLSRQFTSSRMAATGYARLLQIFARPDIVKGLRGYGVEITHVVNGVHQLLPIQEIASRIVQRFGGNVKAGSLFLQNFFKSIGGTTQGTIQASRVLISYVQHHKLASKILRQVTHDHYELKRSLEAAQASPGVRWQEFVNQLKALALEIGAGVLPAVATLADHVGRLATWFNNLSPHTKRAIGYFGAMISVGTLLSGILFVIVGGLASLALSLGFVERALLGGALEVGAMQVQMMLLLGVVGALAFALIRFPGFRSAFFDEIGPIIKLVGLLLSLRLAFLVLVPAINLVTGAFISLGFAEAAYASAFLGALVGPILIMVGALIGLQVAIALLEDQLVKSISYYEIVNGKLKKNTEAHQKEARAIGESATNMNEYLRLANQIASVGPAGQIFPGGGVTLKPRKGSVVAHGEAPGFGYGTVESQTKMLADKTRKAAATLGVVNTQSFKKAYANYLKAVDYERTHKGFKAEMRLYTAEADLKTASQTPAQYKAAKASAAALAKTNKKYSDQFIIDEAKKVAALAKIARSQKTYAAWKAYYAALGKLQTNATSAQMSAIDKMFNVTDSAATKAAKKLSDTFKSVLTNVRQQYDTFLQQNESAFGTLFSGPYMKNAITQDRLDWGQVLNMKDLTKDLASQVKQFRTWRKTISKLQERGLPKSLIDQILALGPDAGLKQAELLAKATPAQIAQYKKLWLEGQKDVHDATMRDLKSQLDSWRKHGRRIALAIARGLRDENVSLEAALKTMIEKAFPQLATNNKPVTTPALHSKPGTSTNTHTKEIHHHDKKEEHTHYHVTTTADPKDAKNQVKEANFHHRTRQ